MQLVKSLEDGATFAMKIVSKPTDPIRKRKAKAHTRFRWEILLRLVGNYEHVPLYHEGFETETKFYGILEMMESDMERYLKDHGALSEYQAAKATAQLLDTLARLHAGNVFHRDVKASNVLLRKAEDPTWIGLGDFSSVFLPPIPTKGGEKGEENNAFGNAGLSSSIAGTPFYLAPEIAKGVPYSSKVGIWSTGILV